MKWSRGPLVRRSNCLNCSRQSPARAQHCTRWCDSDRTPPVTAVPRGPAVLIRCAGVARGTALHFASSHDHAARFHLCFALAHPLLLAGEPHHWPPLFLSEPPWRIVIPAATSSTCSKLELMAIASGTSTSLVVASSSMSSPSPHAVYAPPAPPPLRGGPHDLVAHLGPHLHH
jgi:hypothetical protein